MGKQFDRGNAEVLEVRDLFNEASESSGVSDARGRRLREAADMKRH